MFYGQISREPSSINLRCWPFVWQRINVVWPHFSDLIWRMEINCQSKSDGKKMSSIFSCQRYDDDQMPYRNRFLTNRYLNLFFTTLSTITFLTTSAANFVTKAVMATVHFINKYWVDECNKKGSSLTKKSRLKLLYDSVNAWGNRNYVMCFSLFLFPTQ